MDYLHYHLRFKKLNFRYNQKPPRVSLDHVIYELIWMFDNNDNRHVTIAVRRIQRQSRKWLCIFKSADTNQSQMSLNCRYPAMVSVIKLPSKNYKYCKQISTRPVVRLILVNRLLTLKINLGNSFTCHLSLFVFSSHPYCIF